MKRNEQAKLLAIESPKERKLKKKIQQREAKKARVLELQVSADAHENLGEVQHTVESHHDDSNSNYSFTEFYISPQSHPSTDETFKSPGSSFKKSVEENLVEQYQGNIPQRVVNPFATNTSQLADFIPLSNNENTPQEIIREPEVRSDVRMLLTKEHFQILSSQKGQNFLYDLQSRLNLLAQFKWDSTGNSLFINGLPSDQSIFQVEVREFLYKLEIERYEKTLATSSMLPKTKTRVVAMLKLNLQCINKVKIYTIRKTLEAMIQAEKTFDHKKALKCRKTLNVALIGDAELGDGAQHIGALRRITYALEKDLLHGNHEITSDLRDEISEHMKPIFSTMDHGDYRKLFVQYMKVQQQRKKRKMLLNPIIY